MTRTIQACFVAFFSLTLILGGGLPILNFLMGTENSISAGESRKMTTFADAFQPQGVFRFKGLRDRLEEASKDQIPFRAFWVRQYKRTLLYGFGHEKSEGVMVGRDGYWFQIGNVHYSRAPCASPRAINEVSTDALIQSLIEFNASLASEGRYLSIVIAPLQSTVRADLLPAGLSQLCASPVPRLQKSLRQLREGGVSVLYDPDWMIAEGATKFYPPRSFHWHRGGAAWYSRYGIQNGLVTAPDFRGIEFLPQLEMREGGVDMARYLGVAPSTYKALFPKPDKDVSYVGTVSQAGELEHIPSTVASLYSATAARRSFYMAGGLEENGRGVIIGDSFSNSAFDFWGRHFSEAIGLTINNADRSKPTFTQLIEAFDPRHVVLILEESKLMHIEGGPKWRAISVLTAEGEKE